MSVHDIKRPYMVYEGPRPRHAATPAAVAPGAVARPGPAEAEREKVRADGKLAIALSIVGALGLGMGIGVWMTPMLGDNNPFLAPPAQTAPLAMSLTVPAPAAIDVASAAETMPAEPALSEAVATPADARPKAKAAEPPRKVKVATARAEAPARASTTGGCSPDGSRAAVTLCADPAIAAADQDLERAFQRALRSGAPAKALRAEQQAWLAVREEAARRSPADLADVYEQRVAELNAIADDPPH